MTMPLRPRAFETRVRAFLGTTRAGATAIAAAAVTVMTVGAAALITDHLWLVDQRDVLKTATEAATIAATLEMDRQRASNPSISDDALERALKRVARRYVKVNLAHLPPERLQRAKKTLKIAIDADGRQRTVTVTAKADLGGTLLSRALPLFDDLKGPKKTVAKATVVSERPPVEVVLAIDVTSSMNSSYGGSGVTRLDAVRRAAALMVGILHPSDYDRVAVGVVPWTSFVRLDKPSARDWKRNDWAVYPKKRRYPEPYSCRGSGCPPTPVVDTLPPSSEKWLGCLAGERLIAGAGPAQPPPPTAAGLFKRRPDHSPFAQVYFPADWGTAYRCLTDAEKPSGFYGQQCYEGTSQSPQAGCKSNPTILPLSTERGTIDNAIESLDYGGGVTYSALGVLWAQRLLEHRWRKVWGGSVHPLNPGAPNNNGVRKAIVLLTDGEDTWCGMGNAACENSPFGISRTEACALAKEQGTEIFIVAVMSPNYISQNLADTLRACSSETDNPDGTYVFINNTNPADLDAAFDNIANQLVTLRKASG